jgi:hypothetical protein
MAEKEKAWTPSDKQEAPKKVAKKAAQKETKEETKSGLNQDGNLAGQRVTFAQIQAGMKKQKHPVIETSSRRRKR